MKITAEFNSTGEILEFITTFGANSVMPIKEIQEKLKGEAVVSLNAEVKPSKKKPEEVAKVIVDEVTKELSKSKEVEKIEDEVVKTGETKEEIKEEEQKITKEQVRAVFTKLAKEGKQKEAKDLTKKYGATKVSEIKEEDYAEILKEAEALL